MAKGGARKSGPVRGKKAKSKFGGALTSNETKQALAMERARTPAISIHIRGRDTKRTHTSISNARNNRFSKNMSMKQIMDIMCPIFSYKRVGYGNDWTLRHGSSHPANYFEKPGTCIALKWPKGSQGWQEFVALPMHNFGGQLTGHTEKFVYDGFGASISQLIAKAIDVRNDTQNVYFNRTTGTSSTLIDKPDLSSISEGNGATPGELMKSLGLVFDYHGGYQEHVWTNYSEGNVFMEVWECTPREIYAGYEIDPLSGTHFKTLTIEELLTIDYRTNLPLGNNLHPQYTSYNATNQCMNAWSDPGFRINKRSNLTHLRYLVSKPIKVLLKPGDKLKHRVILDPFNFTQSMWNMLERRKMDRQSTTFDPATGVGNDNFLPMLIPQFTKHLVVRAVNEIGIHRASATDDNILGSGYTAGQLSHTCTEYHKCRMMPAQKPKQHFDDVNLSLSANYLMDSVNNEMSKMEDDGLANNAEA